MQYSPGTEASLDASIDYEYAYEPDYEYAYEHDYEYDAPLSLRLCRAVLLVIHRRCVLLSCMLWLLSVVSVMPAAAAEKLADAQVELAGNDVLAGLEHTAEFIKGGQWGDAVETISRIIENHGQVLIGAPVSSAAGELGFSKFVLVSEHCQREIASWHLRAPEALAEYRRRVDELAQQWYDEAVRAGSAAQLQRIVDELLLSSSGDQALIKLGEAALERGNVTLARHAWERVSPQLRVPPAAAAVLECRPGCSWWAALRSRPLDTLWPQLEYALSQQAAGLTWLAYPDTDISLAAVRARLVLASLLEGNRERALLEFELLKRLHPDEEGELAGRTGKYVQLVGDLIEQAESWAAPASPAEWTTLGGNDARNGVAPRALDIAQRPIWRTSLPRLDDDQELLAEGRLRVGERSEGLLSYHVAVQNGIVYVLQPGAIRALDVATGEPAWPFQPAARDPQDLTYGAIYEWSRAPRDVIPRRSAHAGVPRYWVTVDGHRLFARMGVPWTGGDEPPVQDDQRSFLIGIDLRTQKMIFDRITPGEPGWEFESSPLATEAYLYVALRRRDPASAQVRVACYSIKTGQLVWRRDLLRAEAVRGALFEIANSALTLGNDTIYFNTNLGAVAALRAADGRVRWICRYPRTGLRDGDLDYDDRHWARDQAPCLLHHELVIAAPNDCNRLLAIDAEFGQIAWATAPGVASDAVHLAGVGQGHLLASGDYLYWLDVHTGRLTYQFPAPRSSLVGYAAPEPRGYGRPVLAGDQVYWPTYEYIYVFRQSSNRQVRQKIDLRSMGLTGGNLVVADQTLLIAGADQLTALNEWGRLVRVGDRGSAER